MAGKTTAYATALLDAIFTAVFATQPLTAFVINQTSSPATNLYISLHTADPGVSGNQTTSEISYTGYARVAVARTTSGFTVSGDSVSPVADITFGEMTAGTGGTVTFFGIGSASSGTGELLYTGAVSPNIVVSTNVTPILSTSTTVTEA